MPLWAVRRAWGEVGGHLAWAVLGTAAGLPLLGGIIWPPVLHPDFPSRGVETA